MYDLFYYLCFMRINKTISVDMDLWRLFVDDCVESGSKVSWEIDNMIEERLDRKNNKEDGEEG